MKTLLVASLLIVAATTAFVVGRTTAPDTSGAPVEPRNGDFTGRIGDTFRVPSIALYCSVSVEALRSRLLCGHLGLRPRYQVSFERNRTVVIAVGDPGNITVYPERS
jgi:hypothetical protein